MQKAKGCLESCMLPFKPLFLLLFSLSLFYIFPEECSRFREIQSDQVRALQTPAPVLQEIHRLETGFKLNDVAISPKENMLAAAGDEGLALYSLSTFGLLWKDLERYPINDIDFSPQGNWLASAADDGLVTIWDVKQGKRLRVLSGLPHWATSVAFSPRGDYLAAGSNKTIRIWKTDTWQLAAEMHAHQGYIWGLDFACYKSDENCLLASTSTDQTVNIWQVPPSKDKKEKIAVNLIQTLRASTYWVRSAAFSPQQKVIAAASADGSVYVWDFQNNKQLSLLKGSSSYIWRVVFSTHGDTIISAAEDGIVTLWDWLKGNQRSFIQEQEAVVAADLTKKGLLVIGLRFGTVVLLK